MRSRNIPLELMDRAWFSVGHGHGTTSFNIPSKSTWLDAFIDTNPNSPPLSMIPLKSTTTVEVSWFWLRHTSKVSIFLWNQHLTPPFMNVLAWLMFQYSSEIIYNFMAGAALRGVRLRFNIPLKSSSGLGCMICHQTIRCFNIPLKSTAKASDVREPAIACVSIFLWNHQQIQDWCYGHGTKFQYSFEIIRCVGFCLWF